MVHLRRDTWCTKWCDVGSETRGAFATSGFIALRAKSSRRPRTSSSSAARRVRSCRSSASPSPSKTTSMWRVPHDRSLHRAWAFADEACHGRGSTPRGGCHLRWQNQPRPTGDRAGRGAVPLRHSYQPVQCRNYPRWLELRLGRCGGLGTGNVCARNRHRRLGARAGRFNNIVGLKPTRGLLSTTGVVPACRWLDCVSVFALTVGDARSVAEVAKGTTTATRSRGPTPTTKTFLAVNAASAFRLGCRRAPICFFGDDDARRVSSAPFTSSPTGGAGGHDRLLGPFP